MILKRLLWNEYDFTEKSINSITHVEKEIRPNGIVTVRFGYTPLNHLFLENTGLEMFVGPERIYGTPAPTFFDIKDANIVYQLVNDIRSQK